MANQLKQKDIDFLIPYKKKERVRKSYPLWVRLGAAPLALVLLFGGVAGGFAFRTWQVNSQIKTAQSYLNNAENKAQLATAQKTAEELQKVNASLSGITGLTKLLSTYPKLGKNVFNAITTACENRITLDNIEYENTTGVLKLSASAISNEDASKFVDRLRATGFFDTNISYYGFSGENGKFNFSANCPLKAGA